MHDGWKNIAKADVLIGIAETICDDENIEFNTKVFQQDLFGFRGKEAFRKDLQEVKYRGINRFPSLLIRNEHSAKLITGYQLFETISNILSELT